MALLFTLAMPRIRSFSDARLKHEVRRLAGRASYLYDTASSHKLVLRLTFDLDGNRYMVSRLDPYSPRPLFVPDTEPGAAPVVLPPEVRLRDVTVEGIGQLSRGTVSCLFYPEGYVDATVVRMQDRAGRVFTLKFVPLTGRVIIRRGSLEPAAAAALMR